MKREKNNVYVLAMSALVLALCIAGYFYLKGRGNEKNIHIQALSRDVKEVEGLNDILSGVTFISEQKEFKTNSDFDDSIVNISVTVEDQTIAIRALDKSVNVTSISNPVAVSSFYVDSDDKKVDVYVLNIDKKLYHISFAASEESKEEVKVTLLSVPDVASFATDVRMLDDREIAVNFVVAKDTNGNYYTDYLFKDDSEYTLRKIVDKDTSIEDEDDDVLSYGIYSTSDVNPFRNLNFNQRIIIPSESSVKLSFDSSAITFNGWYYESDGERTQKVVIKIKDVKQAGVMCDETAGPCDRIYYLTNSGELYEVFSQDGGYFEKDDDGSFKKSTTLIDKNVTAFSLVPVISYDVATGGEQSLVYKKNDGKTYIHLDKNYNIDKYKRVWIGETFSYPLFVVSKTAKVSNYLQTSEGKNLVAKKIYTFSGNAEDGDGESFIYLYILNEDNYLYELDDYTKEKASKFKNKKVKSITERADDILVTFEDGTTEVIDAYLEYEAK